jgi:hypothetical protein
MVVELTLVAKKTQHVIRANFGMKEDEIMTFLYVKKKHVVQWKARRIIVNEAGRQEFIRKANGQKSFFVTCDTLGKPKTPHCNIWVNMLRGYCSILHPSIDNVNA